VIGAVIAPLNQLVALVNAPLQDLYGLIEARIEQLRRRRSSTGAGRGARGGAAEAPQQENRRQRGDRGRRPDNQTQWPNRRSRFRQTGRTKKMAAVDTVFEQLGSMTVLELVELKKKIEDEWGITAAAPVAVAAPGGAAAGGDGAAVEEKTSFDVVLTAARRPEDPGDQGRARGHRPRTQGGEGPRRRRPERRSRRA
jgi:hypothetical protein